MKAKDTTNRLEKKDSPNKEHTPQVPSDFLRGIFLERKERNAVYSMRAFARDLGMSQSLLSLVLSGKRPLTIKQASQISILLNLPKDMGERFLESTFLSLPDNSKVARKLRTARAAQEGRGTRPELFTEYEVERFKAISHWYHVALLDLATTQDFRPDAGWIARRLGITSIEARDALDRLLKLGLLERKGNAVVKSENKIYFVTQKSEVAIRSFHQQMITKAMQQLNKTDIESFSSRDISAITLAIPRSRVQEAKKRIKQFQEELANLFSDEKCDEVYQFNTQFFPLTEKETKKGPL